MVHILIIDDTEEIRLMLQSLLEDRGHIIQTAANGKQGVHYSKIINFDIIITDIFMPEKDGLETITEIRKINPNIKIIAMSGGGAVINSSVDYLEIAAKLGADYTMNKPFNDKNLLNIIDLLASEKLELNEEDND